MLKAPSSDGAFLFEVGMKVNGATHRVKTHLGWVPAKKIKGKWHVFLFNNWKEYINKNAEFILL